VTLALHKTSVGIYVDLRNPAPWRRPWAAHAERTLQMISEAEALGAGSVWLSEHHGFDDGYLPQPLTFAAAVAARTRTIRIGTAVVLAPLRDARHVAEEAAIVDVLSDGRLELGLGAGYSRAEFDAFGAPFGQRYARTDRMVAEVRDLLGGDGVTPPPVQRPFPLWLGYQGPKGARRAGRLGVGLLRIDRALLDPYVEGLREGGHDPESARVAGVIDVVVADDPDAARERILPHYAHQLNTYRRAAVAGTGNSAPKDVTVEKLRAGVDARGVMPGLAVVDPGTAIDVIRERVAGLPVHHVYCWASIAGMDDDLVDRHLELLLTRVAPALEATT
jgi:alkanesulfonate monooxygenase SsuD/methylene tetrahydromethanopterin reductase-like flavin-dependent oxidoreductase (luciferase family)